jgi:2-C-methyl-D-erythritol 4-phosphate cytidylyltransferase / 2-C-methyl-D-erythritol 2,4-cyclodiphosphate synthase
MSKPSNIVAIIVAAGSGSRVGGDTPKQYLEVLGKAMLYHSYKAFAEHKSINQIYVVIGKGQEQLALSALTGLDKPNLVTGGASRRESVHNGLRAIDAAGGAKCVLIHDAARPFLAAQVIDQLLLALNDHAGAVPVLPVVDSLAYGTQTITRTIDREGLWRIQTPQAFSFDSILGAHENWDAAHEATDDARMLIASGGDVALIDGDEALVKYTFASDFDMKFRSTDSMSRIGTGFDVHRLVAGQELWLCGIKIEHTHGLLGHSDADVALHALTDAILGALALGDIGDHFPPSDPQWRGASSDQFAAYAMKLAADKGYAIGNVDLTIICETPKLSLHRDAMRRRLAEILDSDINAISVKATTTEQLGFTGRGEGIAAQAAVILISSSGA